MNIQCSKCDRPSAVPDGAGNATFRCYYCGAFLPKPAPPSGDTSAAVGLIGGAALGAAVGGPIGAIVGAVIGAVIGREAKGVG